MDNWKSYLQSLENLRCSSILRFLNDRWTSNFFCQYYAKNSPGFQFFDDSDVQNLKQNITKLNYFIRKIRLFCCLYLKNEKGNSRSKHNWRASQIVFDLERMEIFLCINANIGIYANFDFVESVEAAFLQL